MTVWSNEIVYVKAEKRAQSHIPKCYLIQNSGHKIKCKQKFKKETKNKGEINLAWLQNWK